MAKSSGGTRSHHVKQKMSVSLGGYSRYNGIIKGYRDYYSPLREKKVAQDIRDVLTDAGVDKMFKVHETMYLKGSNYYKIPGATMIATDGKYKTHVSLVPDIENFDKYRLQIYEIGQGKASPSDKRYTILSGTENNNTTKQAVVEKLKKTLSRRKFSDTSMDVDTYMAELNK